jgi:dienelactone hydrolase
VSNCRMLAWLLSADLALSACADAARDASEDAAHAAREPSDAARFEEPLARTEAGSGAALAAALDAATRSEQRDAAEAQAPQPPAEGDAALDAQAGDAALHDAGAVVPTPDAGAAERDAGGFAVATARVEIVARGMRTLPLQLWYPAQESARAEASQGHPVSEFEPPGPRRQLLERLLPGAPAGCASRVMHAAFDAAPDPAGAPYPLLVYSHHLEGMRFAQFSVAEELARHGFVVAAPDHAQMTLYDRTDDLMSADILGTALRFRLDALVLRAQDIESVLDVMLDPAAQAIPAGLRGKIDRSRVGAFGHSMGSMTTGVVAQRDTRVSAAAYMAFPPARTSELLNLLDQPAIETFRVPALFMLNQEDASLGAVDGDEVLRAQFKAHRPLSYLVEVRDTGHWSFADDCGLIPDFADGCGRGTRTAEPYDAYDNLNNEQARAIAARYVTAFFASQFLKAAPGPLSGKPGSMHEIVESHPAREQNSDAR